MARARNIKPGLYINEDLAECSIWARFVFPGLWMLADREGRMEDRPRRIKGELLPYDSQDVEPLLEELERFGFILRYEVDGQRYIQILKFAQHQTPHVREKASTIPAPEGYAPGAAKAASEPEQSEAEQGQGSDKANLGSAKPSPRSPDSLIPDSLIPDTGLRIEGKGTKPPAAPTAPKPKRSRKPEKSALPDDFCISDSIKAWAEEHGHGDLQTHFDSFVSKARANGYVYADWDAALQNAIRDDWAKLKAPPAYGGAGRGKSRPSMNDIDSSSDDDGVFSTFARSL